MAAERNPGALGVLANMYLADEYEPDDISDFTSAIIDVAHDGNKIVQNALGNMYMLGKGVEQDTSEGLRILTPLADKGFLPAESFLAYCYFVPNEHMATNYALSYKYAKSAASKGNTDSMQILGHLYFEGLGVETDYNKAYYWFNRHYQETGNLISKLVIGRMYVLALGVEKNEKLVFEILTEVYENGVVDAAGDLGYLYLYGQEIEQDHAKAKELFEICVDNGIEFAATNLGVIYELGLGVEKNIDTAIMWYKRGAAAGSTDAQKELDKLLPTINK